jgi:hypothetical protein
MNHEVEKMSHHCHLFFQKRKKRKKNIKKAIFAAKQNGKLVST